MAKTHDEKCLSANRFGDGFDCICEPDWKAKCEAIKDEANKIITEMEKWGYLATSKNTTEDGFIVGVLGSVIRIRDLTKG